MFYGIVVLSAPAVFLFTLIYPFTSQCRKIVRHTLKILQQMLKIFKVYLTILRHCEVKDEALAVDMIHYQI